MASDYFGTLGSNDNETVASRKVKPMVFSLVVLCLNPFTVPTYVFGRVSCLLKIVGFGKLSIQNPEDIRD